FRQLGTARVLSGRKNLPSPATAQSAPTLVVEDVQKSFGPLEVLKGVSLSAREGDVIAIIGASGSGKSTLLRCINLLEIPDAGRILLRGELLKMKRDRQG